MFAEEKNVKDYYLRETRKNGAEGAGSKTKNLCWGLFRVSQPVGNNMTTTFWVFISNKLALAAAIVGRSVGYWICDYMEMQLPLRQVSVRNRAAAADTIPDSAQPISGRCIGRH